MNEGKQVSREGHGCSKVRWRRRFIGDKTESIDSQGLSHPGEPRVDGPLSQVMGAWTEKGERGTAGKAKEEDNQKGGLHKEGHLE